MNRRFGLCFAKDKQVSLPSPVFPAKVNKSSEKGTIRKLTTRHKDDFAREVRDISIWIVHFLRCKSRSRKLRAVRQVGVARYANFLGIERIWRLEEVLLTASHSQRRTTLHCETAPTSETPNGG